MNTRAYRTPAGVPMVTAMINPQTTQRVVTTLIALAVGAGCALIAGSAIGILWFLNRLSWQ